MQKFSVVRRTEIFVRLTIENFCAKQMKQAKIIINYLLVIGCKNPNKLAVQLLAKTICFSGQFGRLKLYKRHAIELVLMTLSRTVH